MKIKDINIRNILGYFVYFTFVVLLSTPSQASTSCEFSCPHGNTCSGASCGQTIPGEYCSEEDTPDCRAQGKVQCDCWSWCCLVCNPGDCPGGTGGDGGGGAPANKPPECKKITAANPGYVFYGGAPQVNVPQKFTTTAHDPEGDKITYHWSSSPVGKFSTPKGTPKNAKYWVPSITSTKSTAVISCRVTAKGGHDTCSLTVNILPPYTINVHTFTKKLDSESYDDWLNTNLTCDTSGSLTNIKKAKITVSYTYRTSTGILKNAISTGVTDANGIYKLNLNQKISSFRVCASYSAAHCVKYFPVCPSDGKTASGCVTVSAPPSGTKVVTVNYEFEPIGIDPWVTAINGNVYGYSFGAGGGCDPPIAISGKFYSSLISVSSPAFTHGAGALGWAFSKNEAASTANLIMPKYNYDPGPTIYTGGWATNIDTGNKADTYLDKFMLNPPANAVKPDVNNGATSFGYTLRVGNVYKLNVNEFQDALRDDGTIKYRLSPGANSAGVAVLYVNNPPNSEDIIKVGHPLVSEAAASLYGRELLLVVTNASIILGGSANTIGEPLAAYKISTRTNVMADFVTNRKILVGNVSNWTDAPDPSDNAIMLQGPLVGFQGIQFKNTLNSKVPGKTNADYPPQAVLGITKNLLYFLTKMERENPAIKSYTGLGVYDIQWEYQN